MKHFISLVGLALLSSIAFSQGPLKAEKVLVNGKQLYYEVYGSGEPLIFLHGYSLSSKHWLPYVEDFSKSYKIYLIDLTGHGRSDAFNEALSIKSVGEDLNVLLEHLKLQKVKAIGFSFGGDVLFQLALNHPSRLESMITIGAVGSWDVNEFPQYKEVFTFENIDNFPWLRASHQTDQQIQEILDQFENYTIHLSDEELRRISTNTLIMMGDDDEGMNLEEVARVRKHLPKSDLWILPNVSHGAHEGDSKADFIRIAKQFLNQKD